MASAGHNGINVATRLRRCAVERARNRDCGVGGCRKGRNGRRAARWCSVKGFAKNRIAKPIGGVPRSVYWPEEIRPHSQRNARTWADRQRRIQRAAALRLEEETHLPAGDKPVAFERELVKPAEREPIADIEFREPTVPAWVVSILDDVGLSGGE